MKTLAIRLEDDLHAQLTIIAKLEELTVTDAIRSAIDDWVSSRRDNPQLRSRAEAVLADIERDAATRRGAIAALLGGEATTAGQPASGDDGRSSSARPARGNRGGGATS